MMTYTSAHDFYVRCAASSGTAISASTSTFTSPDLRRRATAC